MMLDEPRQSRLERSLARQAEHLARDAELARSLPSPEALARLAACPTSIDCVATACAVYADRPALGERALDFATGAARPLPRYQTVTYAALWARVVAFASGLRHAGLVAPGDRVLVCGFASVEWVVADLACLYLAAVSVPLQTRLPAGDLRQILAETAPGVAVCSLDQLESVAAALGHRTTVRALVVMDLLAPDGARAATLARLAAAVAREHGGRVAVLPLAEVERAGRERVELPFVTPAAGRAGERDPLMTLLYTSGSTGTPKGAMFPESLVLEQWRTPWSEDLPPVAHVGIGYMPLNHAAGRFEVIRALAQGGVTSFVLASDMSTLFEDIRLVRPTRILLVPRIAGMIHQAYQAELVRRARGVTDPAARARVEEEILAGMRFTFLGDRLVYAMAGSAPTAPEVLAFLERAFDVPVIDAYGSTEAGLITRDGHVVRGEVLDLRLESVPELGYRTSDLPYPRGELLVKTRRLVPGYYQNVAASRALFDDEGFLRTGDIVEQRAEDTLVWLDRRANVLKLAQGEFVSTSRLEGMFAAQSPFIQQVYVHGTSLRAFLLAVVVPDGPAVEARLGPAPAEARVAELLRQEIERIAGAEGLRGYEVPRGLIVEPAPFTRENGLLTASNKPSRPRLRERYGARLDALAQEIEDNQLRKLSALEEQPEDAPVADRVALALSVTLGLDGVDLERSFSELGGDSIEAARLSSVLEERLGVQVPVGLILDPTSSGRSLVSHVERSLTGALGISFAAVHGAGATTARAGDLRLDRFLAADELAAAARLPAPALDPRVVLLTGASGFLGRFLLLELLDRLPREGGRVVCLVRARSDAGALARLAAVYRTDPLLEARFQALSAGGRLVVRAGDLMNPRFGLPGAVFDGLAAEVDLVVHDGALVNHALAYPQLFEPNVVGTAEIIRLALTVRRKAIAYVSTVGIAGGLDRADPVREDEDARSLFAERPCDSGYAVGYATSKWASEILLGDLTGRLGVPTAMFRCSMIMPPRGYAGQVNAGDFLMRLLIGLITTGLAPASFSLPGVSGHFDGEPVDFVARSIAALALAPLPGSLAYHVVNPHWQDGVSLDTMVEWLRGAGVDLRRIEDHRRWYEAFRAALEALPADAQQRSALPIVRQWERPQGRGLRFDATRLRQRLAALAPRPGPALETEIPVLTEAYLHQIVRDLAALGLIAPARPLVRAA
jgi:fatty acid CoA ligase FadD9